MLAHPASLWPCARAAPVRPLHIPPSRPSREEEGVAPLVDRRGGGPPQVRGLLLHHLESALPPSQASE
jgi:hypothetical protein